MIRATVIRNSPGVWVGRTTKTTPGELQQRTFDTAEDAKRWCSETYGATLEWTQRSYGWAGRLR